MLFSKKLFGFIIHHQVVHEHILVFFYVLSNNSQEQLKTIKQSKKKKTFICFDGAYSIPLIALGDIISQ